MAFQMDLFVERVDLVREVGVQRAFEELSMCPFAAAACAGEVEVEVELRIRLWAWADQR
ncbi:hypothetical protein [Cereibacter sphaeroides]|uniref:hypothetical protein n=1 Tax=Cereibacter sphaeroides TaxID=1063 RepID=UPI00142D8239|nr:hypothetical protein [Cereibacter sphaeroides]